MEYVIDAVVVGTFGMVIMVLWWIAKLRDQIRRVEIKVDALLNQAGLEILELAQQKAIQCLEKGDKIAAIKMYQQVANTSFSQATAAVDRIEQPG